MSETLSPVDAVFLELEEADEASHMHIGACAVFDPLPDGGVPTLDDVRDLLQERLGDVHHMNRRLSEPRTGGLRWPHWEPGPSDEILREQHVRQAALPAPGDEAALLDWLGDYWSHRLDRSRPLWELTLLTGLEGGRWAFVNKTHHAVVDGVGSTDISHIVLDRAPGGEHASLSVPEAPAEDHEDPALVRLVKLPPTLLLRGARTGADLAVHPGKVADLMGRSRAAAEVLVRDELLPAPATSLNTKLGGTRRFAVVETSLADLKEIRAALGGTVNDVILAACAGALRRLLLERGEEPPKGVRAMVPVNVRRAGEHLEMGNRITSLFIELPVDVEDPAERYAAVVGHAERMKSGNAGAGGSAIMEVVDRVPPMLHAIAAHALFSPRLFNVTITNVPGPPATLYAFGAPLRRILPLVPLFADHTLGIAIVSYDGQVVFGLNADAAAVTDLDVAVQGLRDALAELRALAA